ncbi:hypothetical protein [Pandoraea norimbergensis]|uniref:Uncharacterized protein n=1 Tax=Pandoraea norimbergensis TaxID=93219 RepID=A0ABM5WE75_9BURK
MFAIGPSSSTPQRLTHPTQEGEPPAKRYQADLPSFVTDFDGISDTNFCFVTTFAPTCVPTTAPRLTQVVTPQLALDVDNVVPAGVTDGTLITIASDPKSLSALATHVHLTTSPLPEAKRHFEHLLRSLQANPNLTCWNSAFENLLALHNTLEQRTTQAMVDLMFDTSAEQHLPDAKVLVRTARNTRFDCVLRSRLDAIAAMPQAARLNAWRDTFASVQRCEGYYETSTANQLAKCIADLPDADREVAILGMLSNGAKVIRGPGWDALATTLYGACAAGSLPQIMRATLDASTRAHDADIKDAVMATARHIDRCPPQDAEQVLARLVAITSLEDEYDQLGFTDLEAISMLRDLRHFSNDDRRDYPRPNFDYLIQQQCNYAAD